MRDWPDYDGITIRPENAPELAARLQTWLKDPTPLDYSLGSIGMVERLADQFARTKHKVDRGGIALVMGAYLGEILVRHEGGSWVNPIESPEKLQVWDFPMVVELESGRSLCPFQKCYNRLTNGDEDNLVAYISAAIGHPIPGAPVFAGPRTDRKPGLLGRLFGKG